MASGNLDEWLSELKESNIKDEKKILLVDILSYCAKNDKCKNFYYSIGNDEKDLYNTLLRSLGQAHLYYFFAQDQMWNNMLRCIKANLAQDIKSINDYVDRRLKEMTPLEIASNLAKLKYVDTPESRRLLAEIAERMKEFEENKKRLKDNYEKEIRIFDEQAKRRQREKERIDSIIEKVRTRREQEENEKD